jgi:hypothetical protein
MNNGMRQLRVLKLRVANYSKKRASFCLFYVGKMAIKDEFYEVR